MMTEFKIGNDWYTGNQIGYIERPEGEVAIFSLPWSNLANKYLVVYDLYSLGPLVSKICTNLQEVEGLLTAASLYLTNLDVDELRRDLQYRMIFKNYIKPMLIPPTQNKQEATIVNKCVVV